MSSSDRKRRARMRPPPPTATTMRARRMMDAMTGIAPASNARGIASALRDGGPVPLRKALSCQDNAADERQTEGLTPSKHCRSNAKQKLSQVDLAIAQLSAPMTAEPNEPQVGADKREAAETSGDLKRRARMRPPSSTAATMRAT